MQARDKTWRHTKPLVVIAVAIRRLYIPAKLSGYTWQYENFLSIQPWLLRPVTLAICAAICAAISSAISRRVNYQRLKSPRNRQWFALCACGVHCVPVVCIAAKSCMKSPQIANVNGPLGFTQRLLWLFYWRCYRLLPCHMMLNGQGLHVHYPKLRKNTKKSQI